jgi:DNA polymerase-3 subunit epsilon
LLPCDSNPVQNINHISPESTQSNYSLANLDSILMGLVDSAQVCVAHNAEFDKRFISLLSTGQHILNKPWVCTKANFTWPATLPRLRLEDICNAMRVPYVNAHRALADCLLLAQCFQRVEDLEARFEKALPTYAHT